jgi:hypothetical protein
MLMKYTVTRLIVINHQSIIYSIHYIYPIWISHCCPTYFGDSAFEPDWFIRLKHKQVLEMATRQLTTFLLEGEERNSGLFIIPL